MATLTETEHCFSAKDAKCLQLAFVAQKLADECQVLKKYIVQPRFYPLHSWKNAANVLTVHHMQTMNLGMCSFPFVKSLWELADGVCMFFEFLFMGFIVTQVTWDEPDLLQNVKRVSPWLVEVVSNVPPIQLSPFTLPKKKLRVSQHPEFQFEGHGIMGGLQMATLTNNVLGQINPWHGLSENVPAGMQGARHGHIYGVPLSDFHSNKMQSGLSLDSFHQLEQGALSSTPVSTDLNIGCFSQLERSSVQDNLSCVLTMGNSSQSEQKATKGRSTSSTTKSAPFLLFGKPIHTEQSPKSEQQQQSGVSSSDGPGFHVVNDSGSPGLTSNSSTDGNPEVVDRLQRAMAGRSDTSKLSENYGLRLYCGETLDSTVNNGGGNLSWFKDRQVSLQTLENGSGGKTSEDGVVHCKAFLESEDVGRTLDLSLFSSYEELHNKLAKMFGIEDSDLSNRVLYKDAAGVGRHTGEQPYGDFMKTVRRLTILSDSSSDNMGR